MSSGKCEVSTNLPFPHQENGLYTTLGKAVSFPSREACKPLSLPSLSLSLSLSPFLPPSPSFSLFLIGTQRWAESLLASSLHWPWRRGNGSLPSSPQPLRIPSWFCPIRSAKDETSPGSHDLCLLKGEPLKREAVTLQNSSTLGSASISRKAEGVGGKQGSER